MTTQKSTQVLENFDLNLLQLFRHILETKSMSKAAVRLRITQPAASNGLRRLRDALKDEIFVKGPAGMMPTDFAASWAQQVIPALERIQSSFASSQNFDPATWNGTMRLGVTDYLIETLMYRALPELIKKAPHSQLRLIPMREREPHDDLAQGHLDLALGSFYKIRAQFYQRKIAHESFVVMMRKGHPLANKKLTAAEFAACPQLLIAPWGHALGIVDEVLSKQNLSRNVALTVPYFNAAPKMIECTDLISSVPAGIAEIWRQRHDIIIVPPPIKIPDFSLYMLWAERSKRNPAHEWVRQELLKISES